MCPGMVPGFIVPGYGRGYRRRGIARTVSGGARFQSDSSLDDDDSVDIWVDDGTMENYGAIQKHGQSSYTEKRKAERERLEANMAHDPLMFPLVRQKSGGWKSQQRLRYIVVQQRG